MNRNVIAVVDDLFFAAKIRGTAEQVAVPVSFPRTLDALIEAAIQNRPALIVCDLQGQRIDSIEMAKRLKRDKQLESIPLIGFFSHVEVELQRQAQEAGFDQVLPRSAFAKNLAVILHGRG